MSRGKTIHIHLVDGEPSGIRTAHIAGRTCKALVVPRSRLGSVKDRDEMQRPSMYFLFGTDENNPDIELAYIGEAENVWTRLSNHDSKKPFWKRAVIFGSDANDIDKADIKYLEARCIQIALQTKRCKLDNDNNPSLPNLAAHKKDSAEDYLDNLRLLLSSLGFTILQEPAAEVPSRFLRDELPDVAPKTDTTEQLTSTYPEVFFSVKKDGISAKGRRVNDGFVVYKDSTATKKPNKSGVASGYMNLLSKVQSLASIKDMGGKYVFTNDYLFTSPSAAAILICGNASNGQKAWKDDRGRDLHQIEQQMLKSQP